jgi:hypothetical protein
MAQDTGGNSAQTLVDIIRAYIIDNTSGAVNPAKLRTVLEAIANSVTANSGTAISATPPLNFDAFTNVFSLPVINDLVTGGDNIPLSAEQGVELKGLIEAISPSISEELYCVARLPTGGTTWELVSDANHEPSTSIDGITTAPAAGYNFAIEHNNGYTKVGSFLATVDETYANMGLFIGGSVGKTQSFFKICRNGFSIRMVGSANSLAFANDTGQIVKNTDFTFTFDTVTGLLTIEHPTIVCTYGDMGLLTIQDPCPYTARFVARTPTTTSFKMFNNGVLVTALSSTFKAYYTKLGTFACLDPQIGQSAANFWLRGIMKK